MVPGCVLLKPFQRQLAMGSSSSQSPPNQPPHTQGRTADGQAPSARVPSVVTAATEVPATASVLGEPHGSMVPQLVI